MKRQLAVRKASQVASMGVLVITLLASVFQPAATPAAALEGPEVIGQWSPLMAWPIDAVHATLLPTGSVLTYKAADLTGAHLWDPATGLFEQVSVTVPLFCSGHSLLPDGRVLVTGGTLAPGGRPYGIRDTTIYDPWTKTWTSVQPMSVARWYPTNISLGDGRTMVFSGADQNGQITDKVEVYRDGLGWSPVPGATRFIEWYPHMHLLPSGDIFHSGPERTSQLLDAETLTWSTVADSNIGPRFFGTGVLLPGLSKVLTVGGQQSAREDWAAPATGTAEVIDLSSPTPSWHYTAPMAYRRNHAMAVLLPDGNVLLVGGAVKGGNRPRRPVYAAELFDPETETFQVMASMHQGRGYHSSALLLPDGRVLAMGSEDVANAEIYSPPYLFRGSRPQILAAPGAISYGVPFTMETDMGASIAKVVLMRPGAATHSVDMNQRYVGAAFSASGNTLTVTPTANPNEAPPGYYMMFLVTAEDVPSVAAWVHLQ